MKPWLSKKPTGECHYTSYCKRSAGTGYYCPKHRAVFRKSQNATRGLRRRLGFCEYCLSRAEPGLSKCRRHLAETSAACQRWRDKLVKRRGWKVVRVKI